MKHAQNERKVWEANWTRKICEREHEELIEKMQNDQKLLEQKMTFDCETANLTDEVLKFRSFEHVKNALYNVKITMRTLTGYKANDAKMNKAAMSMFALEDKKK